MPQDIEKKFFGNPQTGKLNADDAGFSIGPDEWVNAENVRTGTTDAGVINTVESIGSTVRRSGFQPSVTFIELGSESDDENGRFIYFLYDKYSSIHKIVCYYDATQTCYDVLLSWQITGGLNFSKDSPIHSARIVNGLLYWVEGTNNQPRKINIERGIKANNPSFQTSVEPYVFPLDFSEITIIKPTASLAPNIQKGLDSGFVNNFIANFSFEFAYQFVWDDNETSVVGTYSPASRLNTPSDTYNYIAVVMDALQEIPSNVKMVILVVRIGNTNDAKKVKTWDKNNPIDLAEINSHNDNISLLTFNFYNNITGQTIPTDYVLKPFDSVPIYAEALEVAKDRLYLGDTVKGYDTPTEDSLQTTLSITGISGVTSVIKPLVEIRAAVNVPGSSNDFAYGGWYVLLTATDINVPGYYLLNGTEKSQTGTVGFLPPELYYQTIPVLDPPPTTTSLAGLTFIGETQAKVINYILYTFGPDPGDTLAGSAFFTRSTLITITGITPTIDSVFKSRSSYKIGKVFYDFAMRKCGVITNDGLLVNIPSRNYAYSSAIRGIIWTLDNANAVNEIPEWAFYYSIVRTLNLKTRSFIDSFNNAAKYVTKDADGNYVFTNNTFVNAAVGIGLDTTALVQSGLGYSFSDGDICIITTEVNATYELPVIGQSGKYIIIKVQDIGDLSSLKLIYEIYTPYQTSDQEPFLEIGEMYRVLNPGTENRSYETTTDILIPDTYTITRNFETITYDAEAMSPNDLFFQTWYNDGGKPNFVTQLGQVNKLNFFSFSNTYIPGTSVNGLSTFEALNESSVPQDCGSIKKMILTSKVSDETGSQGLVMLAICSVETASIYIGETQILDSTGQTQFFGTSTGIIGSINVLRGSFGTLNPESVCFYRGRVYWLDVDNGRWIQYDVNGLYPISNFKMTRFWKLWCKQYASMTSGQIEALGGRPFVFSTVDPSHNELLISIPKLANVPPQGYLPDYKSLPDTTTLTYNVRQFAKNKDLADMTDYYYYGLMVYLESATIVGYYVIVSTEQYTTSLQPDAAIPVSVTMDQLSFRGKTISEVYANTNPKDHIITQSFVSTGSLTIISGIKLETIYPFDILDFQGKTIVYSLDRAEENPHWQGSYSFNPEGFITLKNKLFSFKEGSLYEHNQTTSTNQFYETQYRSKIMFLSNKLPSQIKIYNAISIEGNMPPELVYLYNNYPIQQASDLEQFNDLEGVWYATIYRNKLVPTATGYTSDGLLTGEKMRNTAMMIMIQFLPTTTFLELKFVNIIFEISIGHKV